jgi:hypothetical protein
MRGVRAAWLHRACMAEHAHLPPGDPQESCLEPAVAERVNEHRAGLPRPVRENCRDHVVDQVDFGEPGGPGGQPPAGSPTPTSPTTRSPSTPTFPPSTCTSSTTRTPPSTHSAPAASANSAPPAPPQPSPTPSTTPPASAPGTSHHHGQTPRAVAVASNGGCAVHELAWPPVKYRDSGRRAVRRTPHLRCGTSR